MAVLRTSKMHLLSVNVISGLLLHNVTLKTNLVCQSFCLNSSCLYMSIDAKVRICSFYANGTNYYDVTGMQVYENFAVTDTQMYNNSDVTDMQTYNYSDVTDMHVDNNSDPSVTQVHN